MESDNKMQDMDSDVTVVLTSCGRFDLLQKTLHSFFSCNTYPLKDFIIIEDSGKSGIGDIKQCIPIEFQENVSIIINKQAKGQEVSVDRAYQKVTTKYVFHCEDDWLFYRSGFIEDSKKVLATDENIFSVWLRDYHHDLICYSGAEDIVLGKPKTLQNITYRRIHSNSEHNQCFSFNPGLRYYAHYPKQGYCSWIADENLLGHLESVASNIYESRGMFSVLLENSAVKHLGFRRSALTPRKKLKRMRQRVLILITLGITFGLGYWLG